MPSVQQLLSQERWHEERKLLRKVLLGHGLSEAVKWGKLCYSHNGATVAIIYGMKKDCSVGFFKGSLLADPDAVLVAPGPNSQAMRRIHFAGVEAIVAHRSVLDDFVRAAIAAEDQGLQVAFAQKHNLQLPDELLAAFAQDPDLQRGFEALTPGRQRGYNLHFSGAKQSSTRTARIARCRPKILAGKGMNDR